VRGDFALLVAVLMALSSTLFRKQYLPEWSRDYAAHQRQDVMRRLMHGYEVRWDAATQRNTARLLTAEDRSEEVHRHELLRDRRTPLLLLG